MHPTPLRAQWAQAQYRRNRGLPPLLFPLYGRFLGVTHTKAGDPEADYNQQTQRDNNEAHKAKR